MVAGAVDFDPSGIVLATDRDQSSIAEVVAALDSLDDGAMYWMTPGDPSLVFRNDDGPVAVVICSLPGWVRCDLWMDSAFYKLRDPAAIEGWLSTHHLSA